MSIYDGTMHAHLDCYQDGYDIGAIAYKHKDKDIWDVFFEFTDYKLTVTEKNE